MAQGACIKFELCPKTGHSSTRHVSFCASQHTEHQHKFSPNYISCVTFVHLSDSRLVVHASILPTVKNHGRMQLLRNTNLSQVKSPKGSSSTGPCFILSDQEIDDQHDIEEIGVKPFSYRQALIHSACDSAESISTPPDSDLEDEQFRKMLASPLSSEVSGKLDAESVQKREANAQRTQACHSRRESLMSSSFRDLEASGKPDAVFSCHSESRQNTFSKRDRSNESGNHFESSVHSVIRIVELLTRRTLESLLDSNKDHLLNQARSELLKQEHQVGSLNKCIDELQKQAYAQRLELEDAHP